MAGSLYKWFYLLAAWMATGFTDNNNNKSVLSKEWHPFYVSITEFNFNSKEKLMEISSKVFLDDFEKTLKKQQNAPVELTQPANPKQTQELVSNYFKKHLLLKIDGKPVNLEFVGYEPEGAAVWVYFQLSNISSVKSIGVINTILYELYPSQISIMHAQVGDTKKSTRITNPEANSSFEF
jgi:hypothetical protein